MSGGSIAFKLWFLSSMLGYAPAEGGPVDPPTHWVNIYCAPALCQTQHSLGIWWWTTQTRFLESS